MALREFFLNVSASVTGQAWLDALDTVRCEHAACLEQKFGVSSMLARLLAARGVDEAQFYNYLEPRLRDSLPDPHSFKDMNRVLERIIAAIDAGEKIAIYGDYDVDGACAASIMYRFLRAMGCEALIYIPHRLNEGYGLNREALQSLSAAGHSLIIAVDCGTNDGAAMAGLQGFDLIVLDHHKASALNDLAYGVVNPNRQDDNSGCYYLCAAGVVFVTLVGLTAQLRASRPVPDLFSYLDLVALATVCDIVPLLGANRAFVVAGVKIARKFSNCGMAALAKVAQINEPLTTYHFGYVLGPYINAAGRIADSNLGAQLLCCDEPGKAEELARALQHTNMQRQKMEKIELENIIFSLQSKFETEKLAEIIVEIGDWHAGIVGLLAGRLKDKYMRPAIILSKKPDGTAVGSARSIRGVDIGDLINRAAQLGLVIKGGGHAMAAGLTIEQGKLAEFANWICYEIRTKIGQFYEKPIVKVEAAISARGANAALCAELEKAGPYGAGNPQPVLALVAHKITHIRPMGEKHLSLTLQDRSGANLKAVAFNILGPPLGQFLLDNLGNQLHLVGHLRLNHYRNMRFAQFTIIDAAAMR